MMRVLIIEDERVSARRLVRLLRQVAAADLEQIDQVQDLAEASEFLAQRGADLVFLDLDLYGQDGFEVLCGEADRPFLTVIVSAHGERALEAFDHGVVDFVAKPVTPERLTLAWQRVLEQQASALPTARHLAVRRSGEIRLVELERVLYIQAAGDYSELHTLDGERHLHDKGLSALERLLPEHFIRIHRSYLVDSRHIERLLSEPGSRYRLRLRNGQELPMGRSRVAAMRQRLIEPT